MQNEEVIEDMKAVGIIDAKCITQHPGFNCFCLQKWSLKMSADGYKTKSNARYRQLEGENRLGKNCCPITCEMIKNK